MAPRPRPRTSSTLVSRCSRGIKSYRCRISQVIHPLRKCNRFLRLSSEKRLRAVLANKYCHNCLAHQHCEGKCLLDDHQVEVGQFSNWDSPEVRPQSVDPNTISGQIQRHKAGRWTIPPSGHHLPGAGVRCISTDDPTRTPKFARWAACRSEHGVGVDCVWSLASVLMCCFNVLSRKGRRMSAPRRPDFRALHWNNRPAVSFQIYSHFALWLFSVALRSLQ